MPWDVQLFPVLVRSGTLLKAVREQGGASKDDRIQKLWLRWVKLAQSSAAARLAKDEDDRKAQVVAVGRQLVLSTLRSPSTARFSAEAVLLECPSGYRVTVHNVDAQNGFGAMIRNRACVKFNPVTRQILMSRNASGVSVDTTCAEDVGRSPMLTDCAYLDRWVLTAKF